MIRGTTPTHTFVLPFDSVMVAEVMVIYAQDNEEVLKKDTYDCEKDGNEIRVTLTQEETLTFDHSRNVQIQIRVLTTGGQALASTIYTADVENVLNDEVL